MQNILSVKDINLFRQQPVQDQVSVHTTLLAERKLNEAEALLSVLNMIIGELKQPMTVILGVNDLVQTKVDENDPLLGDLVIIDKQVKRMRETMEGLDTITEYKPTR